MRFLTTAFLLLFASVASGQTVNITATDNSTGATVNVGNAADNSLRVNVVNSSAVPVGIVGTPSITGNVVVNSVSAPVTVTNSGAFLVQENGLLLTNSTTIADAFINESTVRATIRGVPVLMEDAGNVMVPLQGSVANGLLVRLASSAATVTVDSEFAAAATPNLTAVATPSAPYVVNFNYCSNGATWDACRGSPDPCSLLATTTTAISVNVARTVIIPASSGKKNYICSYSLVAGAAEISNIVEGTGTTCQTGPAALLGSTTAANGLSFAINGGIAEGNGAASILVGKTANVDTCLVNASTGRVSGKVTWVQN
jgi:hypothetical protein